MSVVLHLTGLLAIYGVPEKQRHCCQCEFSVVPDQFFRNLQVLLQRHANVASTEKTAAPAEQCLKRPL